MWWERSCRSRIRTEILPFCPLIGRVQSPQTNLARSQNQEPSSLICHRLGRAAPHGGRAPPNAQARRKKAPQMPRKAKKSGEGRSDGATARASAPSKLLGYELIVRPTQLWAGAGRVITHWRRAANGGGERRRQRAAKDARFVGQASRAEGRVPKASQDQECVWFGVC